MSALFLVVIGVLLVGYPWISNWYYGQQVQSEVKVYERQMQRESSEDTKKQWEQAKKYNELLVKSAVALTDPFLEREDTSEELLNRLYEETLCMRDDGLMCFVEIPRIHVYLPVYHGTSEQVLRRGAGHLQSSAFPIGENNRRAVISAHSGFGASKMFSDLTEIEKGDVFYIHVLDQRLMYRVCEIQVIWPEDTDQLAPEQGRDLVSLLTCTPYGINTQRLVVTGERVQKNLGEQIADNVNERNESDQVQSNWMRNYKRALLWGTGIIVLTISVRKIWKGAASKKKLIQKGKKSQRR